MSQWFIREAKTVSTTLGKHKGSDLHRGPACCVVPAFFYRQLEQDKSAHNPLIHLQLGVQIMWTVGFDRPSCPFIINNCTNWKSYGIK